MALPRIEKVLCYVVRDGQLLVFRHRDYPDAGVQVPAGTLREGEAPAAGAIRETEEETGYVGFRILRPLGRYDYEFRDKFAGLGRHEIHVRNVFLLEPPASLPERWSHLAEEGNGDFWFEYSWMPIDGELRLAGEQHARLAEVGPSVVTAGTPTQMDLALRAEAIMWDYERDIFPPGLEVVERDELLMWRRAIGPASEQRWANRVSFVRTTSSNVDRLIEEAFSFFGSLPFTWVVGPSSHPPDLSARLRERGLTDVGDGDLLTAQLPIKGLRTAPDVSIVEVEGEALARVGLRLARPNAPAAELEALLEERLSYLRQPSRRGGFLVAFVDDEPAANAGYRYSSDGATVYFSGAETIERFRGRGIYQTLVAHRVDKALARGCRFAAIRARRDTSLPILMKRGFVDHGHLPIFAQQTPSPT